MAKQDDASETKVLPPWLADIETRCDDDTSTSFDEAMRRLGALLALAKAQHEALEECMDELENYPSKKTLCARRLWEGGEPSKEDRQKLLHDGRGFGWCRDGRDEELCSACEALR